VAELDPRGWTAEAGFVGLCADSLYAAPTTGSGTSGQGRLQQDAGRLGYRGGHCSVLFVLAIVSGSNGAAVPVALLGGLITFVAAPSLMKGCG
jgi:hypothetical protein